jgi:hypothetical protein
MRAIIGLGLLFATGCGTLHNLDAPPVAPPLKALGVCSGQGCCLPFGGVARSGLFACGVPVGISAVVQGELSLLRGDDPKDGLRSIGSGMLLTGAGLVALADTPISLAGDLVTWPVAYARQHEQPWATWWQSRIPVWWVWGADDDQAPPPRQDGENHDLNATRTERPSD